MGYQNGNRPDDIDYLMYDIRADLSDLQDDILSGKLTGQSLLNAISFIQTTVKKLIKKYDE